MSMKELTDDDQFRPPGRTNRSGRTQVDHDVFEGLPIRQWRQVETTIGPPPDIQAKTQKSAWPELPMPVDAHFLPAWSQQLLRVARAGRLYDNGSKPTEEEIESSREAAKAKELQQGFITKKWIQVPRQMEEPEQEYLAKRRKGLPSARSGSAGPLAQTGSARKTKVKRVDPEGSVQVWEVLVPEGQSVEGEITEDDPAARLTLATAPPGTIVDGVGVVNADGLVVVGENTGLTPPRRRPPPPRRKPKRGPGRGRKKVIFAPGAEGAGAPGTLEGKDAQTTAAGVSLPKVQLMGAEADGDTPMIDAGDGEEEDEEEGDEGDEEGEEGEESDENDEREEGELSPSAEPSDVNTPASKPLQDTVAAKPLQDTIVSKPLQDTVIATPSEIPAPPPVDPVVVAPIAASSAVPIQLEPPVSAPLQSPIAAEPARLTVEPIPEQVVPDPTPVVEDRSAPLAPSGPTAETFAETKPARRDPSSSPELPLATAISHSRHGSMNQSTSSGMVKESITDVSGAVTMPPAEVAAEADTALPPTSETTVKPAESEVDLFGSLEKHLEKETKGADTGVGADTRAVADSDAQT